MLIMSGQRPFRARPSAPGEGDGLRRRRDTGEGDGERFAFPRGPPGPGQGGTRLGPARRHPRADSEARVSDSDLIRPRTALRAQAGPGPARSGHAVTVPLPLSAVTSLYHVPLSRRGLPRQG